MCIAWQVLKISGPNLVYGFLGHLVILPQKENIGSRLLFILLSGPRKGGGVELQYEIWIVKRGNMNESGPTGIKLGEYLVKIQCAVAFDHSSPHVKGDYHVWSDTGSITHGAVVFRIINWKGLNAYSVTGPLYIWTNLGVWLPRTPDGPPSKG